MNQEVNFLKALPKEPNYLPASWIALALMGLLALFTFISIFLGIYELRLSKRLENIRAERLQEEKAFREMAKAYPLLAADKPLVERIAELKTQLQEKRQRFKALAQKTLRRPFSQYLSTLTVAVPHGLWLSNIAINQDEDNISLGGYSLKPVTVSEFLQNLQKTAAFKEIDFDLFYVRKVENKNYLQFEVANKKLLTAEEAKDGLE